MVFVCGHWLPKFHSKILEMPLKNKKYFFFQSYKRYIFNCKRIKKLTRYEPAPSIQGVSLSYATFAELARQKVSEIHLSLSSFR